MEQHEFPESEALKNHVMDAMELGFVLVSYGDSKRVPAFIYGIKLTTMAGSSHLIKAVIEWENDYIGPCGLIKSAGSR